jgi:Ca2+-binding EF-hand superfamily protein
MISGISNGNNCMTYMQQAQSTQHKSGPPDLFQALDTDGSGEIDQSELDTWAKNMSSKTGMPVKTSEAISTYDSDGNGSLSSTELHSFLESTGIKPPADGPPPGPPPGSVAKTGDTSSGNADSIISAYDTNGDGVLSSSELQPYLDDTNNTSSENYLSLIAQALSAYLQNTGQSTSAASGASSVDGLNIAIDFSG